MFWSPEVITTTGKSLRITQMIFNIRYIMRTSIVSTKRYCRLTTIHTRRVR
ncbi:hypothetical protein C4A39_03572 [Escherichia coli]|nr:hypothetical protein C4A39_03572 [Escherichia coli]RDQ65326.1 hypothetical protein C4A28_03247 [Escherichia coli]